MKNTFLRNLPKVDILMNNKNLETYKKSVDAYTFLSCLQEEIKRERENILNWEKYLETLTKTYTPNNLNINNMFIELDNGKNSEFHLIIKSFLEEKIIKNIISSLSLKELPTLKRVINGTGTILHTNLGRSVFPKEIGDKIATALTSYSNLEYDILKGDRGSRYSNLEELIIKVTGAEGALVVNNNAGGVLLCLSEFSKNKEVIISRGEMVEIGGSFRIPEIIKFAGANIKEVGTTNRTYIRDYEDEITHETSMLLKVHTSNYIVKGFSHETGLEDIVNLAHKNNLISMIDIGSGNLLEFSKYGVKSEPTIYKALESGVDILTFSGDKLLGGSQAGIILGKKELIEKLKKNQLLRAIRIDKMGIAVLEEVFKIYLSEKEAVENIPTLRLITEKPEMVLARARKLSHLLNGANIIHEIISSPSIIGGGSMPEEEIESFAISFISKISPDILEERFRLNKLPIIGRITDGKFILNMKTIFDEDITEVSREVKIIFSNLPY